MRLPNGFGSVHKLPGNRRKPYRVRITIGWKLEEHTKKIQLYQTIGYYKTKEEGIIELAKYHNNPFKLEYKDLTFEEIYKMWSNEHFLKTVSSATRIWETAFKHSNPLHFMKFRSIRTQDLERTIKNANVGAPTKFKMKNLYNMMYKYAIKYEFVDKNYAEYVEVPIKYRAKEKKPFSDKEIGILWENINVPFVDMILIQIYTGFRPRELTEILTQNVDLKNRTIIGGRKTVAGTNRIVPIHNKILPLVEMRLNTENERLFVKKDVKYMTYDDYRNRFNKVMKKLGMNHKPHEARHTFITLAKHHKMEENVLKMIVGHKINDVTESVYTHRNIEELIAEINKIV